MIVFSDATVSQTFSLVDKLAFPDSYAIATRGVTLPLLSALAYIFIYPYPARMIYAFTLRRQREINETRQRIVEETLLTVEESQRIRAEYVEYDRRNKETVERLREEITRLNVALEAATKVAPKSELTQAERIYNQLETTQLFLLRLLEKIGSPALESELIKKCPEPQVRTEFDIGELERRKLVSRDYDQNRSGYTVAFTHDGRRALLESKQDQKSTG